MILLICAWNWPFMEEQKSPAGKGRNNRNRNWISIYCIALIINVFFINVMYSCWMKEWISLKQKTLTEPKCCMLVCQSLPVMFVCIRCSERSPCCGGTAVERPSQSAGVNPKRRRCRQSKPPQCKKAQDGEEETEGARARSDASSLYTLYWKHTVKQRLLTLAKLLLG